MMDNLNCSSGNLASASGQFGQNSVVVVLLLLVGIFLLLSCNADAQEITKGNLVVELNRIINRPAFAQLAVPLLVTTAGDNSGRLFLPEKQGRIRIWDNGAYRTFLNIIPEVYDSGSRGLLGLAFHPGYNDPSNPGFGKIYTYHSVGMTETEPEFTGPGTVSHYNVVTEWQVDDENPNQIDVETRRVLFRETHTHSTHSGGTLEFGPDGYMYISIGTPGNRPDEGQNLSNVYGTILRVDPLDPSLTPSSSDPISQNGRYRVPESNPFIDDPEAIDEIFAYGLRHVYRFSIDPVTGLLFAGDVGEGTREEVSVIQNGDNLGWPYREGSIPGIRTPPDPPPMLVEPIADYSHADGISVIGGYVYRGSIPELQGKYVFGDFQKESGPFGTIPGRLFWLDPFDEQGDLKEPSEIDIHEFAFGDATCALFDPSPDGCSFDATIYGLGVDENGEVYVVGIDGSRTVIYSFASAFMATPPIGDYNEDGVVNAADYVVWRNHQGQEFALSNEDPNVTPGMVTPEDYDVWVANFGATTTNGSAAGSELVPEPATFAIAVGVLAALGLLWVRRPR